MKRILSISVLMLIIGASWSQAFHDFETWYRFKASTDVNDELRLYIGPAIRFDENSSQLSTMFTDLSASYEIHKYFKPKLNYRIGLKNRYDLDPYVAHRVNIDLGTDVDVGELNFDIRNRTQYDFDYRNQVFANRTKLKVTFDAGEGIKFFTSGEFWVEPQEIIPMNKYRFSFGSDIKLKKRNELTVFYRRQTLTGEKVLVHGNIIGVSYRLKLKDLF